MKLERKIRPFELKAAGDGSTFEGLGAVFLNVDRQGDMILPGAFKAHLPYFLASGFIGGLNHDWDNPIGSPTAAEESDRGLKLAARISDTGHGRDVKTLLKDGVVKRLSIGYVAAKARWLETMEDVAALWAGHGYSPSPEDLDRAKYGVRALTEIKLYEVSPVSLPSNDLAVITAVKGAPPAGRPFDEHLRAALESVEEVCDRAAQLAAKRGEAGRPLPPQRVAVLRKMSGRLAAALLACEPKAGTGALDLAAAAVRLQAECDGLLD